MIDAILSPRTPALAALFTRFLSYVRPERRDAALCAALAMLIPLAAAGLVWGFSGLIDEVMIGGALGRLPTAGAAIALFGAVKLAAEFLSQVVEARTSQSITNAIRRDTYAHVLALAPASRGVTGSGEVLTHLKGDAERAEYLVFTGPVGLIEDALTAIVFTALLLVLSWQLTIAVLLAVPLMAWLSYRLAPAIRRMAFLARTAEQAWMQHAGERIDAQPLVYSFGTTAQETLSFSHRTRAAARLDVGTEILQARQSLLIEAAGALGGLAVLSLGTWLIAQGALTVGALAAFFASISSLYGPVKSLAKASGRFQHAAAGAQRIASLLDQPSAVAAPVLPQLPGEPRGAIEFKSISYAYPGHPPALSDINLTIGGGETVALVGTSGGGKSTLLSLLLRHAEPGAGTICIDGTDIRDLDPAYLRSAVVPVFQEPYLLSGSIARNIAYGLGAVPADRISAAARAAAVVNFTSVRHGGLTAAAGIRGTNLSGGQRQRIALARALMRKAPVLVLDEATSAVDSETENAIKAALAGLKGTCTMIVVAHRMSSVIDADRIVVMEQGRIVECGTPGELLNRASRCRALFSDQLSTRAAAE